MRRKNSQLNFCVHGIVDDVDDVRLCSKLNDLLNEGMMMMTTMEALIRRNS